MSYSILVVDDEAAIRQSLQGILEDESYLVDVASSGAAALEMLQRDLPDLVLLDIWMPGIDGLETLSRIKVLYPALAVVMISGHGTIETAVRATKLGAFDFIEKPLSLEKVLVTVQNAIRMSLLEQENATLRGTIDDDFELVGESDVVQAIRDQVRIVAPTTAAILVSGEKGTGKEAVGHAVHRQSLRRDRPFVVVNCAAVPEEIMESEIFGHEKGAFPGALTQKKGKIDFADGGTLFIEEVAEMPLGIQGRIATVINERSFSRMGGGKPMPVDVRIMASTSTPLDDAVRIGLFSEALYYLVNVVPIDIAPLRARKADIPRLIEHFLEVFCRKEMREGKTMTAEALSILQSYDWPGNVRELKNIMERLIIMIPGPVITAADLPEHILSASSVRQLTVSAGQAFGDSPSLRLAREEFEREFLVKKLEEHDWNITRTAEAIELERSNLHRKIRNYGIEMKK